MSGISARTLRFAYSDKLFKGNPNVSDRKKQANQNRRLPKTEMDSCSNATRSGQGRHALPEPTSKGKPKRYPNVTAIAVCTAVFRAWILTLNSKSDGASNVRQ